ncbi:MAG: hypothetical protein GY696_07705 [Gammaproteobacteria bacterium]|nr:hypothetical protein [Gammaproteobacteria bacterium]
MTKFVRRWTTWPSMTRDAAMAWTPERELERQHRWVVRNHIKHYTYRIRRTP